MLAPSLWAGATSGIPIAAASHCHPVPCYARISRPIPFRFCNLFLLAIPTRHSWLRVSTHRPACADILYHRQPTASTIITCANAAIIIEITGTTTLTNTTVTAHAIATFTRGLRILSIFPPHICGHAVISVVVDEHSDPSIPLVWATPRLL